jgi:hypothetical protein
MQTLRYKLRMGAERTVRMILITMIRFLSLEVIHLPIFPKIKIKGMRTVLNQKLKTTNF